MLKERMQILVSTDQRRRLEQEARRRGTSVASVIREALDAQLGTITVEDRRAALDGILAMQGRFAPPDELNRIAASEHDDQLEELVRAIKQ
jgi:predicted transcriptional regulator